MNLKKTVCLVEDDNDIRELIEILLHNSNYSVMPCPSVATFDKQMKETVPDLIILDVMLSDGNGLEVCTKLKSTTATKNIPVLIMSAGNNNEKRTERGVEFIDKPFDINEFIKKVDELTA